MVQTQNDAGETPGLDLRWHLAESAVEVDTTELEFALMRTFEGFGRWQSECLASVCDLAATGPENALLHIIRMNDRPKTIKDLARLTNRDDVPNIQYLKAPLAMHVAYWHQNFSQPMSAECVNVSAMDGQYLFNFTDPPVPEGWGGIRPGDGNGLSTPVVVSAQ